MGKAASAIGQSRLKLLSCLSHLQQHFVGKKEMFISLIITPAKDTQSRPIQFNPPTYSTTVLHPSVDCLFVI